MAASTVTSTELAYTKCGACLAIRRDVRARLATDAGREAFRHTSYWGHLLDMVADDILIDADMSGLHACHHERDLLPERQSQLQYEVSVIVAGLLAQIADAVPSQEVRHRLAAQSDHYERRLQELRDTADAKAREEYQARLREAHMRIANVEALVHLAHSKNHKTMRYDEVRAAIDWHTGEEIPETTRRHLNELRDALRGTR